MKQILHIFAKDVRLFYPEILISLALTFVFVQLYPPQWGAPAPAFRSITWLPEVATVLVPISWWVLVARVVHAESMVGDRQFWITRPYRWPNLMASKALFIAAFVYAPFFVAQCALLKEAGFSPLAQLPGIFFNLAMATGVLVLPLVAIATITGNFGKMSLAILILLIYAAMIAYFYTLVPTASAAVDYSDQLCFGLLVCTVATIIVVQYATRRTLLSRSLMAALAVTLGLLSLFAPDDLGMRLSYPMPNASQPLELALGESKSGQTGVPFDEGKRETELSFPLLISGVLPGTAIKADNAKVSITSPDGEHWESHWQGIYLTWLPGQTGATISLKVNTAFFERVKAKPVSVELSFALTELQSGKEISSTVPSGAFMIPGGSICAKTEEWSNNLFCRSALRQPPLMLITTRFSTEDCSGPSTSSDGDSGMGWIGTTDTDPAEFGITSVWTTSVYVQTVSSQDSAGKRQYLCPGSTLAFTPYTVVDRRQQKVVTPAVHLADLATQIHM